MLTGRKGNFSHAVLPVLSLTPKGVFLHQLISSEVKLRGRDSHIVVGQSPAVSVGGIRLKLAAFPHEPVVRRAHRVTALLQLVFPTALRHAAKLHAAKLRGARKVHVEASEGRQADRNRLEHEVHQIGPQGREVSIHAVVAQGEGNGRVALQGTLDGHTHGARVVGIHGRVVAMVDAADDEVETPFAEEVERHLHAVGGRARARAHLQPFLLAQHLVGDRVGRSDGAAESAAGRVGSHHEDVGHGAERVDEEVDAGCLDTVVVGDEYVGAHRGILLFVNRLPFMQSTPQKYEKTRKRPLFAEKLLPLQPSRTSPAHRAQGAAD